MRDLFFRHCVSECLLYGAITVASVGNTEKLFSIKRRDEDDIFKLMLGLTITDRPLIVKAFLG